MQRMIWSVLASFVATLAMGPALIPMLTRFKFGQTIRDDGPKTHLKKQGVPTMGGIMMAAAMFGVSMVLSYDGQRYGVMLAAVLFSLGFGLMGFADDFVKVRLKRSLGLKAWQKIVTQLVLSAGLAVYCYLHPAIGSSILVPFLNIEWDLGWFYIPFAMFTAIAVTNSVNLLDGVDGLCSGVTLIVTATFSLITLFMSGAGIAPEISPYMMVFASAAAGACLGFLRFNAYPARIIMGDTGAFALGGMLTVLALFTRMPLLFVVAGGMYVATAMSDVIQIGYFKITHGKRVFKMAPLHHHFELCGMQETTIVTMYMLITVALCLVSLLSLNMT